MIIFLIVLFSYFRWVYRGREKMVREFEIPRFQAHRGYHLGGIPENTLAALVEAKKRGALMAEFDVHQSSDGDIFLYHDSSLKRMHGIDQLVAKTPSAELSRLGLTRLKEVLESSEVPQKLNIEIKSGALWSSSFERRLSNLIKDLQGNKQILVSSFNPFSLLRLRFFCPNILRALLVSDEKAHGNYLFLRKAWFMSICGADLLHADFRNLSDAQINWCRFKKIKVVAWTVNEVDEVLKLEKRGVKNFISDKIIYQDILSKD